MTTLSLHQTRHWIKSSPHPLARTLLHTIKQIRGAEIPAPRLLFTPLYSGYRLLQTLLSTITRTLLWTPLFKGRLQEAGRNLYLYGGIPYISGPLQIELGDNCRISGQTTFSGRTTASPLPLLKVGSNVDISWMTTIAVGSRVELHDNVRIAGGGLLAGYPGHPLDARARAAGLPELDEQVGAIILEKDVWLATGVYVMAGVHIGRGTVVAAGSIVTHDLPAGVLAAGAPARVIRPLKQTCSEHHET